MRAPEPHENPDLEHIAEQLRPLAVAVDSVAFDPANARKHTPRNLATIKGSLKRFGQRKPIVVNEANGVVEAGNGTLESAIALGWGWIAALRVVDDPATATAFAIADNRTADLAEWDDNALAKLLQSLDKEAREVTGFDDDDLSALLKQIEQDDAQAQVEGNTNPDNVPEVEAFTQQGDLWILGQHRLLCEDCTQAGVVERATGGVQADLTCTDPPYCSGGFQETGRSGKSRGSVGTDRPHKQVANDRLSTRGYQALLTRALHNCAAPFVYVFTDWRMWIPLFDLTEASGYGVHSMIVWAKPSAGMGRCWRAQHELIMWSCKDTPPFSQTHSGCGNVIAADRTGNKHHTTEKPVDLLCTLIETLPFVKLVVDPFAGSGSTLIACHKTRRTFAGVELDPLYCDRAVRRWEDFTGLRAACLNRDNEPRERVAATTSVTAEAEPEAGEFDDI